MPYLGLLSALPREDRIWSRNFHAVTLLLISRHTGHDAAESNHQSQWKDWLIGQGDWKFRSRPGFDSCQFADQAEMYCWAQIENSVIC